MSYMRKPASFYKHVQETPSTVWTIEHGMNGAGLEGIPAVDVFIQTDDEPLTHSRAIAAVAVVDNKTVTVTFAEAQLGYALVVI